MEHKGRFFIGVDCEGVACVVGEPQKGLKDSINYPFAARQATLEADAAARALFDCGAKEVIVWDNHGNGVNLDYDLLDPAAKSCWAAEAKPVFRESTKALTACCSSDITLGRALQMPF